MRNQLFKLEIALFYSATKADCLYYALF